MIHLNFVHLCDTAFLSQSGNLNVIGIFENIVAGKFPAVHPSFTVVTSLKGDRGEHRLYVRVINSETGSEISQAIDLGFAITDETKNLGFINTIVGSRFEGPGSYEVHLFVDDELLATLPFKVMEASKVRSSQPMVS